MRLSLSRIFRDGSLRPRWRRTTYQQTDAYRPDVRLVDRGPVTVAPYLTGKAWADLDAQQLADLLAATREKGWRQALNEIEGTRLSS